MKLTSFRLSMCKAAVILFWVLSVSASVFSYEAKRSDRHLKFTFQELVESSVVNAPTPPPPVIKAALLFCLTSDGINHRLEVKLSRAKELHINTYERNPFYRLASINAP